MPPDEEDLTREQADNARRSSFEAFAQAVNDRVPLNHSVDLHELAEIKERGICGEIDCGHDALGRDTGGRVVPTRQGLCPRCAGIIHDARHIDRMRMMAAQLAAI